MVRSSPMSTPQEDPRDRKIRLLDEKVQQLEGQLYAQRASTEPAGEERGLPLVPIELQCAFSFCNDFQKSTIPRFCLGQYGEPITLERRDIMPEELMAAGSAFGLIQAYFDGANPRLQRKLARGRRK